MLFWIYLTVILISTFCFAAIGCYLLEKMLAASAVVDEPNARSNHTIPTPRGGGIAVIGAALAFMMITGAPALLLVMAAALAIISFLDDRYDLLIWPRLLVQILAVGVLFLPEGVLADTLVFQGLLPLWLDHVMIAMMLLGFMNIFNFMDGIDGISGAQTIAIGLGIACVASLSFGLKILAIDGLILATAAGGFLLFNWHPARLFLGDVGSIPLGFLLGVLLLLIAAKGYWVAALLLPAYYLIDGGLTLLLRAVTGQKIWKAHSQHAYQKAVRKNYTHSWVVTRISMFNYVLILLASFATAFPQWQLITLIAGFVITLGGWMYLNQLPHRSDQIVKSVNPNPNPAAY